MNTEYIEIIRSKTDEELIEILKNQQDYQYDFCELANMEACARKITFDVPVEEEFDEEVDLSGNVVQKKLEDNYLQTYEKKCSEMTQDELKKLYFERIENPQKFKFAEVQILKNEMLKRGIDLKIIDDERENELFEGKRGKIGWIVFGYALALGAAVGIHLAILSILIGAKYAAQKRKNRDGVEYYMYDNFTRQNGRLIIGIALILTTIRLMIVFQ